MNNYEYIIASLPIITNNSKSGDFDVDAVIGEIREQLSEKDKKELEILLEGYSESIDAEFYRKAFTSRNRFIRDYFLYDLNVRNTKVDYLNSALGRQEGQDRVELSDGEFEERGEVDAVLSGGNLMERERGLDDLMWRKSEELAGMDVFTLNSILAFVVRMKIIDRWFKLDPETGKEYLRKLISDVRSTFDKINYTA